MAGLKPLSENGDPAISCSVQAPTCAGDSADFNSCDSKSAVS